MVFGKVHSFSRDLQSTIPLHYNVDDLWLAGQRYIYIYIYIHVQKIFMSTYIDTSFLFKINPNTVDMDFRGLKMASNFKNRSLKRLKCEHDGTGVMTDTEWRNGCWSYSPGSACRWYLGLCAFSICTCTTLESRILWPVYGFQPRNMMGWPTSLHWRYQILRSFFNLSTITPSLSRSKRWAWVTGSKVMWLCHATSLMWKTDYITTAPIS